MISVLRRLSVGSAFVSSASRMVGSSYRVWDAYNPLLRQQGATPAPELVIRREGISLGLSWIFGLFTSVAAGEMEKAFKIPAKVALFVNVVVANILAEGISRLVTYRKVAPLAKPKKRLSSSWGKSQLMTGQLAVQSSSAFYPDKNKMARSMPISVWSSSPGSYRHTHNVGRAKPTNVWSRSPSFYH